jgi:hypothetical protein
MAKQMFLLATVLAGASVASAQPRDETTVTTVTVETPGRYSYAWTEPGLATGIGVGLQIGGGIAGFTSQTVRDTVTSNVEGMWQARAVFGTHIPLGLEVAYIGTTVDIKPLGTTQTGRLLGTEAEGALRFNILPHNNVNPYVFAGLGWQRYDVRNVNFNLSDTGVRDQDTLLVYPMGAGLGYRESGIVADLRGTFRPATGADLVRDDTGGTAKMHTWDVSANLGYEF